jgi:membrane protease YdiL (CAAX protease family)
MPAVSVAVYMLMRWMHLPLSAPQLPEVGTLLMALGFFFGALGEELGWSGYVLDALQARWNALGAGMILGLVAVLWHLVPLLLLHRSPTWIAWWSLYAVSARILIVWLYSNTGRSVFAVALFHATLNIAYTLFPVYGSYFDMRLGGLVVALAAALATAMWGSKTLARFGTPDIRCPHA